MRFSRLMLLSLILSTNVFAQDVTIVGTLVQSIKIAQNNSPDIKKIKLLNIKLSDAAIEKLGKRTTETLNQTNTLSNSSPLPPKVELGTNQIQVHFSPIFDGYNASFDTTNTRDIIDNIKKTLNEKDRVTVSVLLLDRDLGIAGAVGTKNSNYDTWVLTPEMARTLHLRSQFAGHEMVITGYDDNAIAVDENGREHKGLFTVRNSWGEQYGDKGNFYMSYDYFKVLVFDAHRIRILPSENENPNTTTA